MTQSQLLVELGSLKLERQILNRGNAIFVQIHCAVYKWKNFVTLMFLISFKLAFKLESK